jgi:hypothetical protein
MQWLLLLEAIGVVGFVAVQMGGVLSGGYGLLRRFGFSRGAGLGEAATQVDRAVAAFYRWEPRRLALSVACNFLGWFTRAMETWLILSLIGAAVPVSMALVIEAFSTGISFATFFLPTDIGVDEGGAVATFLLLGLSGATGLSFSLVRRVRDITWTAIGLILLAVKGGFSSAALRVQGS